MLARSCSATVIACRQSFADRNESDSSGAFATDPFQHGVIIACADAKIASDDLAFALFGQYASEEAAAFLAAEAFLPEGQGLRQRRGAWRVQPALDVFKDRLAAGILDEVADERAVQIDIERSCHTLLFFRRRGRQSQLDSQGMQDRQRLSDLAGLLTLFEVNYEAQPSPRGQRQVLLGNAQILARRPDQCADLLGRDFHRGYLAGRLPYGNRIAYSWPKARIEYRTGIFMLGLFQDFYDIPVR